MVWTELHTNLLGRAFEGVLGASDEGTVAFVRCLTPDVVAALARDAAFAPRGWQVWRVSDADDPAARTVTADRAVEIRETKGGSSLLLVDTDRAGAGMDGIYSAARQVNEASLFAQALRFAASEVTRRLSKQARDYAERAIRRARGFGRRFRLSPWTEFDFLVRLAAENRHPGELLHLLGLWPVQKSDASDGEDGLDLSRLFVDRLLGTMAAGLTPAQRIESLKLQAPSDMQIADLERFLRSAAAKPLLFALADLADKRHLWVNALRIEGEAQTIQGIELLPWRSEKTGKIVKSSGLVEDEEAEAGDPPVLILKRDADKSGDYSKLEVKWKAKPANLEKGAVQYRVAIVTDMDEELAWREVTHSAKKGEEKCRFSNDDFSMLNEDASISAKVVVSVLGNDAIESPEREEFRIRFGELPETPPSGVGKKVRAFSEGLIELDDREAVTTIATSAELNPVDSKGFSVLRTRVQGKSYRLYYPPLVREIDQQWAERAGAIGRWRVKVRASGARVGEAEFLPLARPEFGDRALWEAHWDRATTASRRMADQFVRCRGSVGQIYDEQAKWFDSIVKEYVLAWAALLENEEPLLAVVNTVEVQSLSGRTLGLIVPPSHPLRVAWHAAYDNLVLHAAFEEKSAPKDVREEFSILDGAMFPAFLPGVDGSGPFVFADTLGFHCVGMVPDCDKEPKAAMAVLARALGESETADTVPTVGRQSAQVLGNEILKYLECHDTPRLLHVHALRPGDGLTVARSLGCVQKQYHDASNEAESEEGEAAIGPAFVLELYPSQEQRGVAGRFISEAREKRRSGAGALSSDDYWMLESLSLPGGVNLPKLRWARKDVQDPKTAAHLAVAFDTFESRVVADAEPPGARSCPLFAFGLISFFERDYTSFPSPLWRSAVPPASEGQKHPSDRTHTDRLVRMQQAVARCVACGIHAEGRLPALRTEISPEKAQSLRELHRLCDWVITLDRNAGVEYFDSPRDNREIYDAYVIDCVPEREDLGCLQLITSTANLEEVRNLLDCALDQMGLSRSRRNAEFLMEHLKALSGRLAIRLTGQKTGQNAPTSELIALAMCHANCGYGPVSNDCWLPLDGGFFIPVDDVRDLLPPLNAREPTQGEKESRPDLIYVAMSKKGLLIRFIEVKYRRHLRAARDPELLNTMREQVGSLRSRWEQWYPSADVASSFQAVRRAKLARVMRFYADKAHRHYLPKEQYDSIRSEINRMIEGGSDYSFANMEKVDRGWVFCPEYAGANPLEISPAGWDARIFLFGPGLLPDSDFRRDSMVVARNEVAPELVAVSVPHDNVDQLPDSKSNSENPVTTEGGDRADSNERSLSANVEESSDVVASICLGADLLTAAEVRWLLTVKGNPHLLVAGLPGMGKTTCLLNLCRQMLDARIRPIVFSYHQDIDERLSCLVPSIRFVDFHGLGFNPLQVIDRESRMAYLDVAGALRDIVVAIFPELGDIQGDRVRKAIKDSFIERGWDDPNANLSLLQEPEFARFMEILQDDPRPDRGLRTLLARLDELGDYGFFATGQSRGSLWDSEEPIVIRIHTTQNDNLQRAFASLLFYGLYKDMFRRGIQDRITHALVFDEAHRAAKLGLIPTMAKECRKYGISLVIASQEARDFNVSLFSTIANYLVLRLTEADAKALIRNVASSDQERALIDKIKQMDRFKALYFCEGRKKPSPVALLG